jgi:hypothetical protein
VALSTASSLGTLLPTVENSCVVSILYSFLLISGL